jgi:hypothetical protein
MLLSDGRKVLNQSYKYWKEAMPFRSVAYVLKVKSHMLNHEVP